MQQQITNFDESGFARSLEAMVATVLYGLHIPQEVYYHSLMLILDAVTWFQNSCR
ncbi:MAG: hypothetical protein LBC74_06025 [Planctomycetaceae bacterium]|jgi:hypothetical protein|nr:hypothetical protein [Planctomycetaceae bacterium]